MQIQPRDYQLRVINKTIKSIEEGHKSILINAPTGAGKTIMGHIILSILHEKYGWKSGWTAMRKHLLVQAEEENVNKIQFPHVSYFSTFMDLERIPKDIDVLFEDECLPSNAIIQTELGPKTIKWIVDNEYQGKILTFHQNSLQWKKVTNWWKRKSDKPWINPTRNLMGRRCDTFKQLWCTPEHRVFYVDNPLNPTDIKYDSACSLKDKYIVTLPTTYKRNNINRSWNSDQIEVAIGCLLGDGSIGINNAFRFGHGPLQEQYLDWKHSIFGGDGYKSPKWSGFLKSYNGHRIQLPITAQSEYLRKLFYQDNKRKRISNEIVNRITWLSIAIWYMDDGCYDRGGIQLHTEGFDKESVDSLVDMLNYKFNISAKAYPVKKGKYQIIKICKESRTAFINNIYKYIHPTMAYKLCIDKSDVPVINSEKLSVGFLKVNYINDKQTYSSKSWKYKYDIEVEDAHRFFANGYLVHNCQHSASASSTELAKVINPKITIGATATPFRTDRMKLCYSKIIQDAGLRALIDQGYLSPYHHYIFNEDWTPEVLAQLYARDRVKFGKSVMFFLTEDDCNRCAGLMRDLWGIKCHVVTGSSDQEAQIHDFNHGDAEVLINCFILTEGFDSPILKTAFIRPGSKGPTVQMGGRVFRRHTSKPFANIVQNSKTRWPFTKIASAESKFFLQHGEAMWESRESNSRVEIAQRHSIVAITKAHVELPDLIKKFRKRKWAYMSE